MLSFFFVMRALTLGLLRSHEGPDISCLSKRCVAALVSEIHESIMIRGPSALQPRPNSPPESRRKNQQKQPHP